MLKEEETLGPHCCSQPPYKWGPHKKLTGAFGYFN